MTTMSRRSGAGGEAALRRAHALIRADEVRLRRGRRSGRRRPARSGRRCRCSRRARGSGRSPRPQRRTRRRPVARRGCRPRGRTRRRSRPPSARSASTPRASRLRRAPSRARRSAIALPIPRPAPVTTTCRPYLAPAEPSRARMGHFVDPLGRVAQRESTRFTREGSLVRSQPRPSHHRPYVLREGGCGTASCRGCRRPRGRRARRGRRAARRGAGSPAPRCSSRGRCARACRRSRSGRARVPSAAIADTTGPRPTGIVATTVPLPRS